MVDMRTASAVEPEVDAVALWAARPLDSREAAPVEIEDYMCELELSPCTSEEPHRCLLRRTCDLPSGPDPNTAIANLLDGVERSAWPALVAVRVFDFLGPIARIDDGDAEKGLLSPEGSSPLWPEIRDHAAAKQIGLIQLNELRRLIVPVLALEESGGRLEWSPGSEEWVLQPELALEPPEPEEWPLEFLPPV